MICYYKATLQFDDGHSDVSSLTPIVADWCQKESDRFSRIIRSRIDGPVDEQKVRQFSREKDLQMASRIILLKRANDRKAAQK